MFGIPWIEWVGYLASALIVISLVMTSITKLRVINTAGCVLFVWYGCMVQAYPVAISNLLIVLVNLYHLYRIKDEAH